MKLDAYLTLSDMTIESLAKEIDINRTSIYRFITGAAFPRPENIDAIAAATGGWVTANDFMDVYRENRFGVKTKVKIRKIK